jgi:hypothetical protein
MLYPYMTSVTFCLQNDRWQVNIEYLVIVPMFVPTMQPQLQTLAITI